MLLPLRTQALKNNKTSFLKSDISCQYKHILDPKQKNNKYWGTVNDFFITIKFSNENYYSFSLMGNKYFGERFTWNPNNKEYYFNLHSFHFGVYNKLFIKKIIIGDYKIGYGQGIVINRDHEQERGNNELRIIKSQNKGIAPYNGFSFFERQIRLFRGVATTFVINNNLDIDIYYSTINLNAKIKKEQIKEYAEMFLDEPIYNSAELYKAKATIKEKLVGISLLVKQYRSTIGINIAKSYYSIPIKKQLNKFNSYNQDNDYLTYNVNASIFGDYRFYRINVFSEVAMSKNKNKGIIIGLKTQGNKKLNISILTRYYDAKFYSIAGKSFKQNFNENRNEKGMYTALQYDINKNWKTTFFVDLFKNIVPEKNNLIKRGLDIQSKTAYTIQNRISISYKLNIKLQDKIFDLITHSNAINNNTKFINVNKLNFRYKIFNNLWVNTCFITRYNNKTNNDKLGKVIIHGFNFNILKYFNIYTSLSLFKLGNNTYKDSIYAFEQQMPYDAPFTNYLNNGYKITCFISYVPFNKLMIDLKYSFICLYDGKINMDHIISKSNRISIFSIYLGYST